MKKFDAIIIGFGKGGKTLAGFLASQGKQVAMIEKDAGMYGGTCINVGCIPSKSLVTSALQAKKIYKDSPADFEERAIFYQKAIAKKRRLTSMLRTKNYNMLNDNPNVTVFHGIGSFVSATQINIETPSENFVIAGEQIFIDTGSTPTVPDIPQLKEHPNVHYSNTLLDLETLPKKLAIIGGGYISLEFASIYSNFGSEVTVMQRNEIFLSKEDADVSEEIKKILEKNGVKFVLGAKSYDIEEYDTVLVAVGRRPNTDQLNLSAAGIETTSRGAVAVNENLQTNIPHIWAIGDVAGSQQFTYISLDDFRIIKQQLTKTGSRTVAQRKNVPYSVFIDPAFSMVGMTEKAAKQAGHRIKVNKLPAASIPKAQVLNQPEGMLKAIVDADTSKILGAALICEESYEMINLIKLAIDMDADFTVLRDQIFTHPTMSESLNDLFAIS